MDVGAVELPRRAAGAAQRALHERVGREAMPVLGDALAVGNADDGKAMADRGVERRPELDRLVDLAEYHACARARAVGDEDVVDRLALRRGVDDEQALDAAVRE